MKATAVKNGKSTELAEGIVVATELVTPEIAREYLTLNYQNRSVYQQVVSTYAADILNGNWKLTHQGVAFDWNGHLRDGQHRLLAIIQANRPVYVQVSRNLDPGACDVMDQGRRRDIGDAMQMHHGIADGRRVSTLVKSIHMMTGGSRATLSLAQVIEREGYFRTDIDAVCGILPKHSPTVLAAFIYARRSNPTAVDNFARHYLTGDGLSGSHPAQALRSSFTKMGESNLRPSRRTIFLRVIGAIYCFLQDRDLKQVKPNESALSWFKRFHK